MRFLQIVIYFAVFSFGGWVSETIITSFNAKRFVKRGFLSGPFIPVYGFGGLIVVLLLAPFQDRPLLLYIVGVISVTILEYCTGTLMEEGFGLKLWSYDQHKYQIKGRIWIVSSLFFGVLGLFATYVLFPPVERFVLGLTPRTTKISGISLIVYFLLDTTNSVLAVTAIRERANLIAKEIEHGFLEANEKYQLKRKRWNSSFQERLLNSYPNMELWKNEKLIPRLREVIEKSKEKRKSQKKEQ